LNSIFFKKCSTISLIAGKNNSLIQWSKKANFFLKKYTKLLILIQISKWVSKSKIKWEHSQKYLGKIVEMRIKMLLKEDKLINWKILNVASEW
jgi:hypothetical protein